MSEMIKNNRWKGNAKQQQQQQQQKDKKEKEGDRSYSERVRAKWFCCAFKLGFLQLICKASLTFKSKLELALSIILKERVIRVKVCCGGVYLDV